MLENKNGLLKILGRVYAVIFILILLLCIFYQSDWKKQYLLDNPINILLGIGLYALFSFVICYKIAEKIQDGKKWNRCMAIVTLICCVLLLALSLQYCFRTGWDVHRMMRNASLLADGKFEKLNNEYYSRCPNNVFLTCIFSLAYKVANYMGKIDGYFVLLAVQCVLFAWAGYFLYRAADLFFKEENRKYSLLVWFIYMFLAGLSPWIVIPYSDSVAMFLVTLCLFLYFKMYEKNYDIRFLFLFTFFGVMGYSIKPQIFILFIAFGIITCVTEVRVLFQNPSLVAKKIGIFLLAAIFAVGIVQITEKNSGFVLNKEARLGITHFFMMGWHEETRGVYYRPDVDFSISFSTREERKAANIEVIQERISDMGITGVIKFVCEKNLLNYNDGTFAWGVEGDFYKTIDDTGQPAVRKLLSNYYYNEGEYHSFFQLTMQILWMGTIFLNIFAAYVSRDKRIAVCMLAILGLTLFETLFEARARYLFGYVSLYIFLAAVGLCSLEKLYTKYRRK